MSFMSQLLATTQQINPNEIGYTGATTNANTLITDVLNTAYMWGGIICVLIIIIAGYFYVTANGDATKIKRGKDAITGAIIGLVVILLAFTITQFVIGRF